MTEVEHLCKELRKVGVAQSKAIEKHIKGLEPSAQKKVCKILKAYIAQKGGVGVGCNPLICASCKQYCCLNCITWTGIGAGTIIASIIGVYLGYILYEKCKCKSNTNQVFPQPAVHQPITPHTMTRESTVQDYQCTICSEEDKKHAYLGVTTNSKYVIVINPGNHTFMIDDNGQLQETTVQGITHVTSYDIQKEQLIKVFNNPTFQKYLGSTPNYSTDFNTMFGLPGQVPQDLSQSNQQFLTVPGGKRTLKKRVKRSSVV